MEREDPYKEMGIEWAGKEKSVPVKNITSKQSIDKWAHTQIFDLFR